jgi:uncharacterized protein YjiS (DUF1127 family)
VRQYGNTMDEVWSLAAGNAKTAYLSAAALFRVAGVLQAGGRFLSGAAKVLDAWLENRRVAAATLRDLEAMTGRELLDIGLTRIDAHDPRPGAPEWYRL